MPRNGSGTYVLPVGYPVIAGTPISPDLQNTTMTDLGGALTQSLSKDGQTVMAGNLPMGGYKLTGLGNGSEAMDSVPLAQVNSLISAAITALLPANTIVLWNGLSTAVPSGWALCDGTLGTPDLRDRFVIGSSTTRAVGSAGGSLTQTLTSAELPGHTHSLTIQSGAPSADHTHSGVTDFAGLHTHDISKSDAGSGALVGSGNGNSPGTVGSAALSSGNHQHNFTTGGMSANHTHTVSGTTDSTGTGSAFSIIPAYLALCYIMKL